MLCLFPLLLLVILSMDLDGDGKDEQLVLGAGKRVTFEDSTDKIRAS